MSKYLPAVFLSGSGDDHKFMEGVADGIIYGLAEVYTTSFKNGEDLLRAMETRIQRANVFALFISAASIASHWVGFEIDTARIEKILRPDLEIRVYAVTGEVVDVMSLPNWMRKYWVPQQQLTATDISRQLNHVLLQGTLAPRVFGRGASLDVVDRLYARRVQETGLAPNVFVFSGQPNIGRRTLARGTLGQIFSSREAGAGPVVPLNDPTEPADIYRRLRDKWLGLRSFADLTGETEAFAKLSLDEQMKEIRLSLQHFADLGEAIFFLSPRGLFDDFGKLEQWALALIGCVKDYPRIRMIFISNRQPRESDLQLSSNLCHFHVKQIDNADVQALVTHELTVAGISAGAVIPERALTAIGGHPVVARVYARLVERFGPSAFENDPYELYLVQDEILSEGLDYEDLSADEADVLAVLSWVPAIRGDLLFGICNGKRSRPKAEFFLLLNEMFLSSLIEINGDTYAISPVLRAMFRRKHGFSDTKLLKSFSTVVNAAWNNVTGAPSSEEGIKASAELIDLFAFMFSLEGKALPHELRALILPSALLVIMREIYERAKESEERELFERIVNWAQLADLSKDGTIVERITALKIRSLIRLQQFPKARTELDQIASRGFHSRYELEGFYYRTKQEFAEALKWYRNAWHSGIKHPALLHEYATCLFREGEQKELRDLLTSQDKMIGRNAYLLDLKAQILVNEGNYPEAERSIATLRASPEDGGRSYKREALLLMKRDQNYQKAVAILDPIIEANSGRTVDLRMVRCIARAWGHDFVRAEEDADFVSLRPSGRPNVPRLKAHIELARGKWALALQQFGKIPKPNANDRVLYGHILEAKASDATVALQERKAAQDEAALLRKRYGRANEFDI